MKKYIPPDNTAPEKLIGYLLTKIGFTLIELLIVISIIAILASLLLPSLISARKSVMRINCAKNLKQIGVCSEMYVNDYQGWLPPMSQSNFTGCGWRVKLLEYAGLPPRHSEPRNGSVFVCPVVPDWIFYDTTGTNYAGHYLTGYGYNRYLTTDDANASFMKINTLSNPSGFIMYGDTYDEPPGSITYLSRYLYGYQTTTRIGDRHQSGINTGWADGHASWHKKTELMNHTDWYTP